MSIETAIANQLSNRVKRNEAGQLLCRRCSKVIPEDHLFVLSESENSDVVWGPCCSDECLCYLKICSECNKDYIIDRGGEIEYQGDGVWLCHECLGNRESCTSCGGYKSLQDSPIGRICKSCFDSKFFHCESCNTIHLIDNEQKENLVQFTHVWTEGKRICKGCFSVKTYGVTPLKIKVCVCCGEIYSYKRNMGYNYCPKCIRSGDVVKCFGCNNYHHKFDDYRGKFFCKNCEPLLQSCSNCESYDLKSRFKKVKGTIKTHLVCRECYQESYIECKKCGHVTDKPSFDKEGFCDYCKSAYKYCSRCKSYHFGESRCRLLMSSPMNYSYRPPLHFNTSKNENPKVFFGFENEINYATQLGHDYALRTLYTSYPATIVYAKQDGSVESYGFEVVSQPMSYKFFKELNLVNMFEEEPKLDDKSCGLHVHVSKASFEGESHLYKFISFINEDSNKEFISKMAGRAFPWTHRGATYAQKINLKDVGDLIKNTHARERYHGVNLTNKETYEIRIFKGAKDEQELRQRIEFALALIEFTRTCSIKDCKSVEKFEKWVKNNSYDYKFLWSFMNV